MMIPSNPAGNPDEPWCGMAHAHPDLDQACRMVLDYLHTFHVLSDKVAEQTGTTQARIADALRSWMSAGRLSEALQRLQELGLIERHRAGYETYMYLLTSGALVAARVAKQQVDSAALQGFRLSGAGSIVVFDEHGKIVGSAH